MLFSSIDYYTHTRALLFKHAIYIYMYNSWSFFLSFSLFFFALLRGIFILRDDVRFVFWILSL